MEAQDEGFAVDESRSDGWVVLGLRGDLDIAVTDRLNDRLATLKQAGTPVRLDLSRLEFIDSSGLACITQAVRDARANGHELEVERELGGQVQRLLELVDGEQLFWPSVH